MVIRLGPMGGGCAWLGIDGPGESVMSKADEFRRYAEEAMGWARDSKDEKQRAILINLARAWAQAAASQERPAARHDQAA